jgi:hypothetical protein
MNTNDMLWLTLFVTLFLVEEDVSSSPSHVALLSAEGVMAQAHLIAEAIEERFWLGGIAFVVSIFRVIIGACFCGARVYA